MEISADIYAWLVSIDVLNLTNYNFVVNEQGNINLDKITSNSIYSGCFFKPIFNKTNQLLNNLFGNVFKLDEKIEGIENSIDNSIKLKNWTLILEFIGSYYGIKVDSDYKALLVANDIPCFNDLFDKLYNFYLSLEEKVKKKKTEFPVDRSVVDKVNDYFNKDFNEKFNTKDQLDTIKNIAPYKTDNKRGLQSSQINNEFKRDLKDITELSSHSKHNDENYFPNKMKFQEDFVDLDDPTIKDINKTTTILDFIISIICKSMTMNKNQALSLLSDNRKYLNYILMKGLQKIDFNPVKTYYKEFLSNVEHYINLIDINSIAQPNQISKNIDLSLNCLKPGLLSKNIDVVYLAGRVLSKVAYDLTEKNLISNAWDWFIMPEGGLEACVLMLKRHDSASEVVVSIIMNFARFHLYEFFTVYLKRILDSDGLYISFLCDLAEGLSKVKSFCDEFIGSSTKADIEKSQIKNENDMVQKILADKLVSIKKSWVSLIKDESSSLNMNIRLIICQFLGEVWSNFSYYFEEESECYDLLDIFKSLARDKAVQVQYSSITQMFRLLFQFSKEKNFMAPIFYKSLVFILIENQNHLDVRSYILNNFQQTFKMILNIPVGILIEPYSKQILYSKYDFGFLDINFLECVSNHPRLVVKDGILLLDILAKIYSENPNMYKVIKIVFLKILSRFMMYDLGVEFTLKYVKFLIISFCTLDKEESVKIYSNAVRKNLNPNDYCFMKKSEVEPDDDDYLKQEIIKNSYLEMIFDILHIKNSFANISIKHFLIGTQLRHFKVYNFYNLNLSNVIEFYGESQEVIHFYNANLEELKVDKEFISQINKIYDKIPEVKELPEEEILLNQGLKIPFDDKSSFQFDNNDSNYHIVKNEENNIASKTNLIQKGTKLKRIDNLGKKAIKDIEKAKEKFILAEKNKELVDEIKKLKDEKFLPKNRQFSVNREVNNIREDLNNYFENRNENVKDRILNRSKLNNDLLKSQSRDNFNNYVVKKDVHEFLNNVDYNNLIKSEGYTNMTKDKSNNPQNLHNKYQILGYDIPLLDLDNEEDCDLVSLKGLLKDYHRFFRFMLNKYSGSLYHPIYGKNFTAVNTIKENIAPSEIVKMFIDHDIIPKYISKDEILVFTGMMNMKVFKKATSKLGLSLNEFTEIFIQLAYFIFTRPPYTFANYSIVQYVLELIKCFALTAQNKSFLTVEYIHPNELMTPIEYEICDNINEKLDKYGPSNVILPEGYKKVLETEIHHKYSVPECIRGIMGTNMTICFELVDELVNNVLYNIVDNKVDNLGRKQLKNNFELNKHYNNYISTENSKATNNIYKSLTEWSLSDKCHIIEPTTKVKETYKARPIFMKLPKEKDFLKSKNDKLLEIFKGKKLALPKKKDNNINTNYNKVNNLDLSKFKENSKDKNKTYNETEVQKIFDEIEGNQSDDEFKKTLKRFLNDEINYEENNLGMNNIVNYTEDTNLSHLKNIDNRISRLNTKELGLEIKSKNLKDENNTRNIVSSNKDRKINKTNTNATNKDFNRTNSLSLSENRTNNEVMNKIKMDKIIKDEVKKQEEIEKEAKRRRRMEFIKEELNKLKEQKNEKDKRRLELLSEERKKREDKKRKKLETEAEIRLRIKQELENLKRIKSSQERKKLEEKKKKDTEKAHEKLQRIEVFNKKQLEKTKLDIQEIEEKKLLKEKKLKEKKEGEMIKELQAKKEFDEFFKKEKEIRNLEKDLHLSIEEKGINAKDFFNTKNTFKNSVQLKDNNSYFSPYKSHIKLVYDIYAKTSINPDNELNFESFMKFANNFNINGLLMSQDELQFIFKKISFKANKNKFSLSLSEFSLSFVYMSLFSLDNFVDTSDLKIKDLDELEKKITYYKKICMEKQKLFHNEKYIKQFFEFLEFEIPFNKIELENFINIQKNMNHLEKQTIIKSKNESLLSNNNYKKVLNDYNSRKDVNQSYGNSVPKKSGSKNFNSMENSIDKSVKETDKIKDQNIDNSNKIKKLKKDSSSKLFSKRSSKKNLSDGSKVLSDNSLIN